MRTLKLGLRGADVSSLQQFLLGYDPNLPVDGEFTVRTETAVMRAQSDAIARGLKIGSPKPEGVVGPLTQGAFLQMGWIVTTESHPGIPPKPAFFPLTSAQKASKFGTPGTAASVPVSGGPIIVNPSFQKNIVRIALSDYKIQVARPNFGPKILEVHRLVEKQWRALLSEIDPEDILSCGGSWAPRYVRGSTTTFSSHAFATAVDFNVPWNGQGCTPALETEKGSLLRVIKKAEKYKIYSGIHLKLIDAMHLESTCTDAELNL